MSPQRVLVIGASGKLGSLIRHEVNSQAGLTAVGTARSVSRTDRRVEIADAGSIAAALRGIDAAVVAVPQMRPVAQAVCAEHQIPCVDIAASAELLGQARAQLGQAEAASVMMCGLVPGLSGMLAVHAAEALDQVSSLRVGFLQSSNAKVGTTGTADMLRMISQPVTVAGREQPGFSQRRSMDFAGSTAQLRVISHHEAQVLSTRFPGVEVEYCTAWDSPVLNGTIGALSRMRVLRRLAGSTIPLRLPHHASRPETVRLTAEASGVRNGRNVRQQVSVQAASDYGATAKITAEILQQLLSAEHPPTGVVAPLDFLTLKDIDEMFDGEHLSLHG